MNTYSKFAPSVFVAKCTERHEKGEIVTLTSKYGQETDVIVYNFLDEKNGFFYYSFQREDGMTSQDFAAKRAEKYEKHIANAVTKSNAYLAAAREGDEFLILGEPVKVGHHSEKRHRALINRNNNRMKKAVDALDNVETYEQKTAYWKARGEKIDLSMPESLEYFKFKLEGAVEYHEGVKSGKYPRVHDYTLTYAGKSVKDLKKKVELATKLWG